MNYPYTLIITTAANELPKDEKINPPIGKIFKLPNKANFDSIEKAREFAMEFLKEFAGQRISETRPHRIAPVVVINSVYSQFCVKTPTQAQPQPESPRNDTYKFAAITQLGIIVADTKLEPPTSWHTYADAVYIFPCGYEPTFINTPELLECVETISECQIAQLLEKAQKQKSKFYLHIIKSQKNTEGNEFADTE